MPDREDVLREATALVERAELEVAGAAAPIVVGFRRDGSASFYFGSEPVYQFNRAGELRRAYADDLLYKAERGKLIALRRERTEEETALVRRELTEAETAAFLARMHGELCGLRDSLARGDFRTTGQVPAGQDVVGRIAKLLAQLPVQVIIASAPNVR